MAFAEVSAGLAYDMRAKANNPLVEYDPSKPASYILYLDANNLVLWQIFFLFIIGQH